MKMKYRLQGVIVGIIVSLLLVGIPSFAASGIIKTVDINWNFMEIRLNGEPQNIDNLIYDGKTYIALRSAGELLGKKVTWEGGNVVNIEDQEIVVETPLKSINLKSEATTHSAITTTSSAVSSGTDNSSSSTNSGYIQGVPPGTGATVPTENILTPLPNSEPEDGKIPNPNH